MDLIKSLLLGIIEGVTEFLPVSSTAHLMIGEKVLNFRDTAEVFTVVIQLGAILAACWFFKTDIVRIAGSVFSKDKAGQQLIMRLICGLTPAFLLGLIIELTVGIPRSIVLIAWALIAGGIVLWIIERWIDTKPIDKEADVRYESITIKKAILIGLGQCLAIVPGVSRSGATIATGLVSGINRPTATSFSFLLSIPIMLAASSLQLIRDWNEIKAISGGFPALFIGFIMSALTAFVVVKWLLKYVQRHDFKPFAYYRIFLGIMLLIYFV